MPDTMDQESAVQYLAELLNKTLHVYATDGRKFVGQLKCTDRERNVILTMTQEYRQPSAREAEVSAAAHELSGKTTPFKVGLKRRFVGLVVIPGQYITKIEIEE